MFSADNVGVMLSLVLTTQIVDAAKGVQPRTTTETEVGNPQCPSKAVTRFLQTQAKGSVAHAAKDRALLSCVVLRDVPSFQLPITPPNVVGKTADHW